MKIQQHGLRNEGGILIWSLKSNSSSYRKCNICSSKACNKKKTLENLNLHLHRRFSCSVNTHPQKWHVDDVVSGWSPKPTRRRIWTLSYSVNLCQNNNKTVSLILFSFEFSLLGRMRDSKSYRCHSDAAPRGWTHEKTSEWSHKLNNTIAKLFKICKPDVSKSSHLVWM